MGHIKVELDFIPVGEKLPENTLFYPVIECGEWYCHAQWLGHWWFDSEGESVAVTHWAEIPEMGQ